MADEKPKEKGEKKADRLSLYGVDPEEAIKKALKTPPPPDKRRKSPDDSKNSED